MAPSSPTYTVGQVLTFSEDLEGGTVWIKFAYDSPEAQITDFKEFPEDARNSLTLIYDEATGNYLSVPGQDEIFKLIRVSANEFRVEYQIDPGNTCYMQPIAWVKDGVTKWIFHPNAHRVKVNPLVPTEEQDTYYYGDIKFIDYPLGELTEAFEVEFLNGNEPWLDNLPEITIEDPYEISVRWTGNRAIVSLKVPADMESFSGYVSIGGSDVIYFTNS